MSDVVCSACYPHPKHAPGRCEVDCGCQSGDYERTPDGHINNCALANGEAEDDCQICGGSCPDGAP